MKLKTKDTDSFFEENYAGNIFNSSKITDRFNKNFSIARYSPLFKKTAEVLTFCFSTCPNSIQWQVFQGPMDNFEFCFEREFLWVTFILLFAALLLLEEPFITSTENQLNQNFSETDFLSSKNHYLSHFKLKPILKMSPEGFSVLW